MTRTVLPLGAVLRWQYRTFTYGSGPSYREVQNRWWTTQPGFTEYAWTVTTDASGASPHPWTMITDVGAGSSKKWWAGTDAVSNSGLTLGLTVAYEEQNSVYTALLHSIIGFRNRYSSGRYLLAPIQYHMKPRPFLLSTKSSRRLLPF